MNPRITLLKRPTSTSLDLQADQIAGEKDRETHKFRAVVHGAAILYLSRFGIMSTRSRCKSTTKVPLTRLLATQPSQDDARARRNKRSYHIEALANRVRRHEEGQRCPFTCLSNISSNMSRCDRSKEHVKLQLGRRWSCQVPRWTPQARPCA